MAFPSQPTVVPTPGLIEAGVVFGAAGLFVVVVFRALGKAALVPLREPVVLEQR
jgi:hypothetical protein